MECATVGAQPGFEQRKERHCTQGTDGSRRGSGVADATSGEYARHPIERLREAPATKAKEAEAAAATQYAADVRISRRSSGRTVMAAAGTGCALGARSSPGAAPSVRAAADMFHAKNLGGGATTATD
jgi:hypothetical protein